MSTEHNGMVVLMEQDEIDEVLATLKAKGPNAKIVEWGCGGSTVLWLNALDANQQLVSIEHTPDWYGRVQEMVKVCPNLDKFTFYLREVLYPNLYTHGYANIREEHPFGLDNYMIPDPSILDADIFFVDGIGRAAVALALLAKSTKPDAVIYIHDYKGREIWYDWATRLFFKKETDWTTLCRLTK